MNLKHKPGVLFRFCLVLIFLLIAASFIVSNSSMIYADDEKGPEVISQNADDEKMSEEMAQKIKELEVITIDNKGYIKDRKDPAKFEHVKHAREYAISCWECHHEYKEKQTSEQPVQEVKTEDTTDQAAQEVKTEQAAEQTVQNEEGAKKEKVVPKELSAENIWSPWGKTKKCAECHDPKEKKNDVIKLQAAYHKNCKNCHMERRIYGDDILAYRKCTSCHK
jgi:FtsZ-interacting cell division protein ZipA